MDEEALFDFEQEIMDQYAAQYDDELFYYDDSSVGVEVESYDP